MDDKDITDANKSSSTSTSSSLMRDSGLGLEILSPPHSTAPVLDPVFHYDNIPENDVPRHEEVLQSSITSPTGASALASSPLTNRFEIIVGEQNEDSSSNIQLGNTYQHADVHKKMINNNNNNSKDNNNNDDVDKDDNNNKYTNYCDTNPGGGGDCSVNDFIRSKFIRMCTPIIDLVIPRGHQIHTNFTPPRIRSGLLDELDGDDLKYPARGSLSLGCNVEQEIGVDLRSVSDFVHVQQSGLGYGYFLHDHPHCQHNRVYSSSYPGAPSPLAEVCMGIKKRKDISRNFTRKLDNFVM